MPQSSLFFYKWMVDKITFVVNDAKMVNQVQNGLESGALFN